MILSEAELELGEDARRDPRARRTAPEPGHAARPRSLPLAEPVLELEVTPNRVDCLGVYGVAREVHAITGAPLAPDRGPRTPRPTGRGMSPTTPRSRSRSPSSARASPRGSSTTSTSAPRRLAQGAADRRGPAADQQRRRHHQLRDAAHRPAAARLRPRPGPGGALTIRTAERGRDDHDPRRGRAALRRRDGPRLRRNGPSGIAGIMGGQVSEVSDETTRRAARGRELERNQHPAHLAHAGPALGGLLPVREAAPPGALHAGPADRLAADGRALRREAGPRDDRRRRGGAPEPRLDPARRAGRGRCSGWRSSRPTRPPTWSGSASASRARRGDLAVTVPADRYYDVTREVDLIEEVGRIHGLDEHLPATLPAAPARSAA